jgi:hypothetical protein
LVIFYINSHGYGHALRMAEVIAELTRADPALPIVVRTAAPASLFPPHPRVTVEPAPIDSAIVESSDTLRVDGEATVAGLRRLFAGHERVVAEEAATVRRGGARSIVADMPFLAGYIAEAAGVPCVAIGNFTWSWVLRPFLDDPLRQWIDGGYARMRSYYRLPFSHGEDLAMFREVLPTPLVTRPLAAAARSGGMPKALVAFRGALPVAAVPGWEVVAPGPVAPPEFNALLASSDVAIGKLGYGLAGMCALARLRLLYAPREGFREDGLIAPQASQYTALRPIPRDDLYAGRWKDHLERILADPMPGRAIDASGARVCAERILAIVQ